MSENFRKDGIPLWQRIPGATGPDDPKYLEALEKPGSFMRTSGERPSTGAELENLRIETERAIASGQAKSLLEHFGPEAYYGADLPRPSSDSDTDKEWIN